MKQFLISILFLLFTFQTTYCQVIEPAPNSSPQDFYDFYMLKHKKNNTAAWICLGGGFGLAIIGTVVEPAGGMVDWDSSTMGAGARMIQVGSLAIIASIPLFIVAGSNKRKARLSFGTTQNSVGNIRFDNSNNLSMSITIPF